MLALFLTLNIRLTDQLTGRMRLLIEFDPLVPVVAIFREPLLGRRPELRHRIVALALVGWTVIVVMLTKFHH